MPAASPALAALRDALRLREEGDASAWRAWLDRELDEAGAPVRLPTEEWAPALGDIAAAVGSEPVDPKLVEFARMLLRFSRPGGETATARDVPTRPRAFWKGIAGAFPAGDLARVLGWWFPGGGVDHDPPPAAARASSDRALGVLRADWTPRGDLLALDQRQGPSTRFELFGAGVSWLGPTWAAPGRDEEAPARVASWKTGGNADVAEWSFRAGGRRIQRLAVMLWGRRLAFLADFHDADGASTSLGVSPGLSLQPATIPGELVFRPNRAGRSMRAILPTAGTLEFDERTRRLRASTDSRWLPMLVSWDHARNRRPLSWTELTVAEEERRCPREVAWAARASRGRDETILLYRSLGPPARRSFLGCSTTARIFVGRFTPEGDVEPIVALA